jgi:hypothetical protein
MGLLNLSIGNREREQYHNTLVRHPREIRSFCLKRGMHYALYTTDHDFQLLSLQERANNEGN